MHFEESISIYVLHEQHMVNMLIDWQMLTQVYNIDVNFFCSGDFYWNFDYLLYVSCAQYESCHCSLNAELIFSEKFQSKLLAFIVSL